MVYWTQQCRDRLTASERYVQGIALYTIRVIPACWHRCASTSPTAWQAATHLVEASSFFSAHSLVEQDSTGSGELLENTSAITWCWVRENSNLGQGENQTWSQTNSLAHLNIPSMHKAPRPAHTPVVELPVGPRGFPAPFLHSQSHLLQVARVPVHKHWVDRFISVWTRFRLRCCLAQTPSCKNTERKGSTIHV